LGPLPGQRERLAVPVVVVLQVAAAAAAVVGMPGRPGHRLRVVQVARPLLRIKHIFHLRTLVIQDRLQVEVDLVVLNTEERLVCVPVSIIVQAAAEVLAHTAKL
jgi:hypothetical protein